MKCVRLVVRMKSLNLLDDFFLSFAAFVDALAISLILNDNQAITLTNFDTLREQRSVEEE